MGGHWAEMETENREVREGDLRLTTIVMNLVGFGWVFGAKKRCYELTMRKMIGARVGVDDDRSSAVLVWTMIGARRPWCRR